MSKFIGVLDYAKKLGIGRDRVHALLRAGRIKGAQRLGSGPLAPWAIPENAPDPRKPAGRPATSQKEKIKR